MNTFPILLLYQENDSAVEEVGEDNVEGESELPAANKQNQTDKLNDRKKDGNVSEVEKEEETSDPPGYVVKEDKNVSENIDNQVVSHKGRNSKKADKSKREFKSKRKSKVSGLESVSAITEYHKPVSYDLGKGKMYRFRNSHSELSYKKCIFKNFTKIIGEHMSRSFFFNKVAGFTKFLKTPILQSTCKRLLLQVYMLIPFKNISISVKPQYPD